MSSDSEDQETSAAPTLARKSTRERKQVVRLSDAKRSLKGKGKASTNDDEEEPESEEEAEDNDKEADGEVEGEDSSSEEEQPTPKKSRAGRKSNGSNAPPKATATNGTTKSSTAPKVKRVPKKKVAANTEDEDDEEEMGGTLAKGDVVVNEDNSIFNAVRNANSSLQTVVDDWVESYQSDIGPALAELVNFILRTCGCNAVVDEHQAQDEDGIVECLDGIQDEFKNATLLQYPLTSKSKALKKFRSSLSLFLNKLITSSAASDILYDETFSSTLQAWLTSLSSSKIRSFRHTSTVISLAIVSALAEVSVAVDKEFGLASRAKEAEEKKGRKDKSRLKDLDKNVNEVHERKDKVEVFMEEWFDSVFVHRYRDSEAIIRTECVKSLGSWMKTHPDHYLEGNYLRYVGWVLSDEHKDVRLEATKALIGLYLKPDVGAMQHFTERFKGQLVKMATGEAEIQVRISSIHTLELINNHGLLETEQRESIATLIYEKEKRVRQAVAKFFNELLVEKVEEKKIEMEANTGKSSQKKKGKEALEQISQLEIKSLAELLVNYAQTLDGDAEDDLEEDDELDAVVAEPEVSLPRSHQGRIALAVEALWDQVEPLRNWEGIMNFLLLDHSTDGATGAGEGTPKAAKGKGRKSAAAKAAASSDDLDDACKLTEKEETLLMEVLVASFAKITGSTPTAKKDQEAHDELVVEVSRGVITALPQLFAKHQTFPGRIVDILSIPRLISLDLYLDMRMITAYEGLWDDVSKQLLKHANLDVIDQAVKTVQYMTQATTLGNTNTEKLTAVEDSLIDNLRECVEDKDIESANFEGDEVIALSAAVARIDRFFKVLNISDGIEQTGDGKYVSGIEILTQLSERGRLGYRNEASLIKHTLEALSTHLKWKVHQLTSTPGNLDEESLQELITLRTSLLQKCEDFAVGETTNAVESVKESAIVILLHIYTLTIAMTNSASDPNGRLADLKITFDDELQSRCAGFYEARIDRYVELLKEGEEASEEDDEEGSETEKEASAAEDSEEEATQKKKRKGKGKAKPKKAAKKQKVELTKRDLALKALNSLVAADEFVATISAFYFAIHIGAVDLRHASVLLIHYERFGLIYDHFVKSLCEDLRVEAIDGGKGELVGQIMAETFEAAATLFIESSDASEERVTVLARLLGNSLIVRGVQLAIVKRVSAVHQIKINVDCATWLVKKIAGYESSKRLTQRNKAILCFKGMSHLVFGLEGRNALSIKNTLETTLTSNDVEVLTSSKLWEPIRSYEKRLVTAASKDPSLKIAAEQKVKKSAAAAKSDPVDSNDEESAPAKQAKAPRPKARKLTKKTAESGSEEEVLPQRPSKIDVASPKRSNKRKSEAAILDDDDDDEESTILSKPKSKGKSQSQSQPTKKQKLSATSKKSKKSALEPDDSEEEEDEEEVESLLVGSSQAKSQSKSQSQSRSTRGSQSQSKKRAVEPESEAEEEVEDEEEEEENVEEEEEEEDNARRSPSPADSVMSLSEVKRQKKKARR